MQNIKKLLKYFKGNNKLIIFSVFYSIIFVLANLMIPYLIGKIIDNIGETKIDGVPSYIIIYFILGLIFVSVIFQYLFEATLSIFTERIMKKIKDEIYKKLNNVSISFIDNHNHGDLLSRTINDVDNVYNAILSLFKQLFQGIIMIISTIIIMFILNYILAIVVLILSPLAFLISSKFASKANSNFKKQGNLNGEIGSLILENLNNIEAIKTFDYGETAFNNFNEVNQKLYVVGQKSQFVSSFANPLSRLINNGTYCIIGVIGALMAVYGGNIGASIGIGGISAFLQYSTQFAKPFNEISSCVSEIQLGIVSLKRIFEILDAPNDIDNGNLKFDEKIKDIKFNHIYFSYNKNQKLIEDFNFEIKYGEKIAIVGPTGCGKTTMVNLLMRFYDPNKGEFLFNGVNSLDIKKKDLRKNFKMVLQDTWIFSGTVLENITYGKVDYNMDEVIKACKDANSYDFIMRLPHGFETKISNNSGLSIGEKQLINITRVMFNKPYIVILDEMTSNIDARSELIILDSFMKLMKDRTAIVIAHRLSTIVNSDKIIVMKDGHIEDVGTHESLLKKKGFYYKLYNSQFEK